MYVANVRINDSTAGILSTPSNLAPSNFPIVFLFHGFCSDKNEVAEIYVTLSEALVKKNISTLRIDFPGCGESSILLKDVDFSELITSVRDTYLYAKTRLGAPKIGICGFSLGAALTMLSFQENPTYCTSTVLLSPVGNLISDFRTFLGDDIFRRVSTQSTTDVDLGWKNITISNKFFQSFDRYNPFEGASSYRNPLLLIAGSLDFSASNAREYYSVSNTSNKQLQILEQYDHILNLFDAEKKAKLVETIVNWFCCTLS